MDDNVYRINVEWNYEAKLKCMNVFNHGSSKTFILKSILKLQRNVGTSKKNIHKCLLNVLR